MVRVRVAKTKRQKEAQGVHITNPTKAELNEAKERAEIKGFKVV